MNVTLTLLAGGGRLEVPLRADVALRCSRQVRTGGASRRPVRRPLSRVPRCGNAIKWMDYGKTCMNPRGRIDERRYVDGHVDGFHLMMGGILWQFFCDFSAGDTGSALSSSTPFADRLWSGKGPLAEGCGRCALLPRHSGSTSRLGTPRRLRGLLPHRRPRPLRPR